MIGRWVLKTERVGFFGRYLVDLFDYAPAHDTSRLLKLTAKKQYNQYQARY